MIEDARKWAENRLAKKISKSTAQEYERVFKRLRATQSFPGSSNNGRTRAVERAAYRFFAAQRIMTLLDAGQHEKVLRLWSRLKQIEQQAGKAKAAYSAGQIQPNAQKRHTKRRSLRGLPADWRLQLVEAGKDSRYASQIRVMALCGCRPEELARGVVVQRDGDELIITIQGAKVSDRTGGGQPWRKIRIAADHPLVGDLCDGEYKVPTPRAIENAVDHFATKLWPRRAEKISAYSLRHAAASDFKAAGLDPTEVAAALGHASTATMDRYGSANAGGKGGLKLKSTEAARKVREPARGARSRPRTTRKKARP